MEGPTCPNLKEYLLLRSNLTTGISVTGLALHPVNRNILAVSYGTREFGKENEPGLVCVWNARNKINPERIYKLSSPATTVGFSAFTPYILAAGTLEGDLIIYDIRDSDTTIVCHTFMQLDKHSGPVWEILWLQEETDMEILMTLGNDGYLKRWILFGNELQSSEMMQIMQTPTKPPGPRSVNASKIYSTLLTTTSIAHAICFFPNNHNFFLLGTEEGFIHKCHSGFPNRFMTTYIGHKGPVFRVRISPFDHTIFLSCGGDGTTRIWKDGFTMPMLTLKAQGVVTDLSCVLYSSTIFACCTEKGLDLWDIFENKETPLVRNNFDGKSKPQQVEYSRLLNSLIIGDDQGSIHVFGLRNFVERLNPKDLMKAITADDEQKEILVESEAKRDDVFGSAEPEEEPEPQSSSHGTEDVASSILDTADSVSVKSELKQDIK